MRTDLRRLLGAGMGAGLALAVGLGAAGAAQAEVESKDPIKLTLHDWTGQLITTKIMGSVLQKAGYNVEYVQAEYIPQFRSEGRRLGKECGQQCSMRWSRDI